MFGAWHSPFDFQNQLTQQLSQAQQQQIAVTQKYAVMMMVRMLDLPEHMPVPIDFHHGAYFIRLP